MNSSFHDLLGGDVFAHSENSQGVSWDGRTAAASALTLFAASMASAGGIGGGGLFVSILNLVMRFDSRTSAVVSAFMVLAGSLLSVLFYLPKRHPQMPAKPLIDYDVALVLQPNMLLGISIGVICNTVFPEWLMLMLLSLFLGYISYSTCVSSLRAWRAESEANAGVRQPLLEDKRSASVSEVVPAKKFGIICVVWIAFYAINVLLKGTSGGDSSLKIEQCGVWYWLISGLQIPLAFAVTVWMVCLEKKSKGAADRQQQQQEEVNKRREVFVFPVMALFAGILGGMLGVGGGMLINPFLLRFGMQTQVTAATCAFMVFFSASMSVAEYLLLGAVPVEYALYFSVLCFLSSLFGLLIIDRAIARYRRVSLIIFSVSSVMCITTVLMVIFGALKVWTTYRDGGYMGFNRPC